MFVVRYTSAAEMENKKTHILLLLLHVGSELTFYFVKFLCFLIINCR